MNQQRSRRFRASKEVAEKINEIERIRADLESQGCKLPPAKPKGDHFDSNCITPVSVFIICYVLVFTYCRGCSLNS